MIFVKTVYKLNNPFLYVPLFGLAVKLNFSRNNAEQKHLSFQRNYPQAAFKNVSSGLFELLSLSSVLFV